MAGVPGVPLPSVGEANLPNVQFGSQTSLETFGGGQSEQNLTNATEGLESTVTSIAEQAKEHADQLAGLTAANNLKMARSQIQIQAMQMRGQDALGADQFAQSQWNDTVQKVMGSAQNRDQALAFQRSAMMEGADLHDAIQQHVANEMLQYSDNQTSSFLENSRNSAVLNAGSDDITASELNQQRAALTDWASRHGIPVDSDTFQAKLTAQLSGTNLQVIEARLSKDSPTNVQDAKDYLAAHKSELTSQDLLTAQRGVEQAETTSMGLQLWNGMKDWTLSNGDPDIERMQDAINARTDLSDERKQALIQFVDGMGREQMRIKYEQDQANTRDFYNDLVQGKKQGVPLADALKLAHQYADDAYTQYTNENAIRQFYASPKETDPQTHLNLWEGIENGSVSKSDINQALNSGKINSKDWLSLSQQLYKSKLEDTDPNDKFTDDRVKAMAQETIGSDKDKMSQFLYVYHTQTQDMSAQQKLAAAKELLSDMPDSHFWSSHKVYQQQYQQLDAQNTAWGKLYSDVGKDQVQAIGTGALYSGQGKWGVNDINDFANQFGGYDKIKAGTPVNNAIQALARQGMPATPANVKAILKVAPDGNYSGAFNR